MPDQGAIVTGREILKKQRKCLFKVREKRQKALIDKMKLDPEWEISEQSGDLIILIQVIENMYCTKQSICIYLIQCTNRNGNCIPFTILISQTTSGTRSLTHGQT